MPPLAERRPRDATPELVTSARLTVRMSQIVPADFVVPLELLTEHALLRPLGPEHNVADYSAWTSSVDHIESTPGFGPPRDWPDGKMSLAENLADLEMHRRHFHERVGFTYTVVPTPLKWSAASTSTPTRPRSPTSR